VVICCDIIIACSPAGRINIYKREQLIGTVLDISRDLYRTQTVSNITKLVADF
jgi:hypothetical protein